MLDHSFWHTDKHLQFGRSSGQRSRTQLLNQLSGKGYRWYIMIHFLYRNLHQWHLYINMVLLLTGQYRSLMMPFTFRIVFCGCFIVCTFFFILTREFLVRPSQSLTLIIFLHVTTFLPEAKFCMWRLEENIYFPQKYFRWLEFKPQLHAPLSVSRFKHLTFQSTR